MDIRMPSTPDLDLTASRCRFPLDSLECCPPVSTSPPTPIAVPPGLPYILSGSPIPQTEFMAPPANRLIDLLNLHYPDFVLTQPLQAYARRAVRMAMQCHTSALGGHVERCPEGHVERIFYNSCGHRFCPRCAGRKRRSWLIKQCAKLLPVRHYHAVFTLSHAFNPLWRLNPQAMGDLLFHSATDALRELLGDERRLGAEPGITVTLETLRQAQDTAWDDRLKFHPHLHCLVTGGGLSPDGDWNDVSNPRCLVAVKPLMVEFRTRWCQGVTQILTDETLSLPEDTTTRHWLKRLKQATRPEVGGLYRHTAGRRRTEPRRCSALSGRGCGRRTVIRRAVGLHQRPVGDTVGVPDIGPAERDPIG